ncbi:Subtilisin-like protease SDD1 [Apostasia shenzhenica]|uniref:Subtilisin-like protease SDD1 n=1 Tax=Apostasia shenzhenica TaxID=1088818 RepID=A0A2I0A535_9ASPA|nr:Subtilisin-like protease SDD1 [Apostasia shenzhenica]
MKNHLVCSLIWLLSLLPFLILEATKEGNAIYLVLVEGKPTAFQHQLNTRSKLKSEAHGKRMIELHDELLKNSLDGEYTKLCSFHHIINGFAVHTSPSQAKLLESASGVLRVERDPGLKKMTTYTPDLLGLPAGAWEEEGGAEMAGEGIVIGVVDSGIDPSHASFSYDPSSYFNESTKRKRKKKLQLRRFDGGDDRRCEEGPMFPRGSCNGKIISAQYFAAGAAALLPLNASDLSPFDQNGHGSHVASIAAGNWGVPVVVNGCKFGFSTGMAPRARLAIYKALYPQGGTLTDLISAIDRAGGDGVDVMVLSIGPSEPTGDGVISFMGVFEISLLFARRAGIFVVQAGGNEGPQEASVVSFSPWAMGVAASTTGRVYQTHLVFGNSHTLHGVGFSAPTAGDGAKQLRLISAGDAAMQKAGDGFSVARAEECQFPEALKPAGVRGSIVICSFSGGFFNGSSSVTSVLATAERLGFAGFILAADQRYGDFTAQPLPLTVPGVMITRTADAQILWNYYQNSASAATAAIQDGRIAAIDEQAPQVARFSSRGPDVSDDRRTPADVLKPDVLAPGHQIWAAWSSAGEVEPILAGDSFALLSGTSMAAPHVAGVAALVKQKHPSWSPAMIASAISTTAVNSDQRGRPIMAQGFADGLKPAGPFDRGTGFVNPTGALDPGLVFPAEFEDYVSFLCSLPGVTPPAVRAATGEACNRPLSSPADLNLPSITISSLPGARAVRRVVLNVAGEPETYTCSAEPPAGVELAVFPPSFTVLPGRKQELEIELKQAGCSLGSFVFGEIVLMGSFNHVVRMPVSVLPVAA